VFGVLQAVAPSRGVEVTAFNVRNALELEHAVATFARASNAGVIVPGSAAASHHRKVITTLMARHRLPAVYPSRHFVVADGLISYGADFVDIFEVRGGKIVREWESGPIPAGATH
jgi:putative ABC transport system substrate-binding protein